MDFIDDLPESTEQERFQRHNRFLRSLKSDTLLIIDNFNATATQDSFLSVVLKYRCQILFTTRSRLDEYCTLPLKEISDMNALFQLASVFYSEADTYRATVEKIIETVHSHIFAVELAAKLPITVISIRCFRYTLYLLNSRITAHMFNAWNGSRLL